MRDSERDMVENTFRHTQVTNKREGKKNLADMFFSSMKCVASLFWFRICECIQWQVSPNVLSDHSINNATTGSKVDILPSWMRKREKEKERRTRGIEEVK